MKLLFSLLLLFFAGAQYCFSQNSISNASNDTSRHSAWIGIAGGAAFSINDVDAPDNILRNSAPLSEILEVSFRNECGERYFWEITAGYTQFWSGHRHDLGNDIGGGSSSHNAFEAIQMEGGFGYQFRLPSGFTIADISAGGGAGMNLYYRGGRVGEGFLRIESPQTGWFYEDTSSDYELHRVYPFMYAAVSRDFRIVGGFYLTLQYKYRQGFLDVYESRIAYISHGNEKLRHATSVIRGSGHSATLGFRYKIN